MRIRLLAVGKGMPSWVAEGYREYARRLGGGLALGLEEVRAGARAQGAGPVRRVAEEGERLLARVPRGARSVALDEHGREWRTRELADRLEDWMQAYSEVCLLVGGADGLAPDCLARADEVWSLSRLTLPHMLVRVLVAEQVYRAWSITRGHPYHREGPPARGRR